jgi:hypothetical protein
MICSEVHELALLDENRISDILGAGPALVEGRGWLPSPPEIYD